MDFAVSEEHEALRRAVAKIAADFGGAYYARKAEAREFTGELWQALGRYGYLGVNIPEEYGGGGAGLAELALVCEETAAQGCPLLLMIVCNAISAEVITTYGTPEQRRTWLPGMASGERKVVFAITEPDAGSNTRHLSTTAVRDKQGYRLNGQKYYISGVDEADAILVVARTGTADGSAEARLSLFLVDTDAPGLVAQPLPVSVALPERQFTLFFDDVPVTGGTINGNFSPGATGVLGGLTINAVPEPASLGLLALGGLSLLARRRR